MDFEAVVARKGFGTAASLELLAHPIKASAANTDAANGVNLAMRSGEYMGGFLKVPVGHGLHAITHMVGLNGLNRTNFAIPSLNRPVAVQFHWYASPDA